MKYMPLFSAIITKIVIFFPLCELYVISYLFLYHLIIMVLNPKIWGPHYWFFLHTIAINYPKKSE